MSTSEPHRLDSARIRITPSFLGDSALAEFRSKQTDISPADSPAVILEVDSRPLVFMRFFEETGATLAILDCWFVAEVPREEFRLRIGQLLQGAIDEARGRRCRLVRVLNSADPRLLNQRSSPWPVQELGFTHRATVSKWRPVESHVARCRLNVTPFSPGGEKVADRPDEGAFRGTKSKPHFDLRDLRYCSDDAPTRTRIIQLLNQIRRDSNDLIRLPKPDAEELVRHWEQKQSRLLIASQNHQDAGLIAWSTNQSHGLAEVTIDYLGVAADFRRNGIARQLILRALTEIEAHNEGQILDVSVMIDNNNSSAVKLYHHTGFRRTPIAFDVWLLELLT
jgi:ribosomal protein S18 acetylase RimI-like enzyme